MYKNNNKFVILVIVIIIICAANVPFESYAASDGAKIAKVWKDSSGCCKFRVEGLNGWGLCCMDKRVAPKAGAKGKLVQVTDKKVIRLVYHAMHLKSDLSDKHTMYLHIALSVMISGRTSIRSSRMDMIDDSLKWAKQYTSKDMPPEYCDFKVYVWKPAEKIKQNNTMVTPQSTVLFEYKKPAIIKLKKTCADPKVLTTGKYSLKDIEYTVYKSDKKTKVGVLKVKNNKGESNSIKAPPGKYYAIESKVPSDSGFILDKNWIGPINAKRGKTTSFKAADHHCEGWAYVEKKMTDGGDVDESFRFELINTTNSTIKGEVITEPGNPGRSPVISLPYGTYIVREKLTSKQKTDNYQSVTKPFKIVLTSKNTKESPYKIVWKNKRPEPNCLTIDKVNLGGGSAKGFRFSISGILYGRNGETEKKMDADEAVRRIMPELSGYDGSVYKMCEWIPDQNDLDELNKAAEEGKTGTYEVSVSSKLRAVNKDDENDGEQSSDKDVEINALVKVDLKPMLKKYGDKKAGDYNEESEPHRTEEEIDGGIKLAYNDRIEFAASRTFFDEITEVTDDDGRIEISGTPYGKYTVTELMTDGQKKRYHNEEGSVFILDGEEHRVVLSQAKEIKPGSPQGEWEFGFKNVDRVTPVKLQKVTDKGSVSDLAFRLTGTDAFGEEIDISDFITDEKGFIYFGELRPGTYSVEETDFDNDSYFNAYRIEGYENPAIRFTVTGEEDGTLWLGGPEDEGVAALGDADDPSAEWINPAWTRLLIAKIDGDSGTFLPGAEFEIRDSSDNQVAKFEIISGEDGKADINMIEANDGITGGIFSGETDDTEPVDEEADETEETEDPEDPEEDDSQSEVAEEETSEDLYIYAEIKGLRKGRTYRLYETKAPDGYTSHEMIEFTMEDMKKIVVENTQPRIWTEIQDADTGGPIINADGSVVLNDTVYFENLAPGREYTLRGRLMYAGDDYISEDESAVLVDGKPVTGTSIFKPVDANGRMVVKFRFDARGLEKRSIVAFEELYLGDDLVTSHSDPYDLDQTAYIPEVITNASISGDRITDIVKCSNLLRGQTYLVKGWMADPETGERIPDSEGYTQFSLPDPEDNEEDEQSLTGEIEVSVKMDVDKNKYSGKTLVACEELYLKNDNDDETLIAEHCDLSNKDQTITVQTDRPDSPVDPPKTGDRRNAVIYILLFMVSAGSFCLVIKKSKV